MRKLSKYKILIKSGRIIDNFPRILEYFRRTKWKKISKYFIKRKNPFKRRLRRPRYRYSFFKFRWFKRKWRRRVHSSFKNFFIRTLSRRKRMFLKMKRYPRECLIQKLRLEQFYNESVSLKVYKKEIKSLSFIQLTNKVVVKYLYRLNVLLWKLHFFASVSEANQHINNSCVFINQKPAEPNSFLNLGDVICFKKDFIPNFRKAFRVYKIRPKFYSFIELDYYSGRIVIVKNFEDFVKEDYSFIFLYKTKARHISNYLKK